MTPRERFIKALRREPIEGHVPHFELVMFLTMEAFGRIHPTHRNYEQWYQMSESERRLHLVDMAETYIMTAEKYHHDAIFVHPNPGPIGEIPTDIESTIAILQNGSEQIVSLLKNENNILQAVTAQDAYAIGYRTVEDLVGASRVRKLSALARPTSCPASLWSVATTLLWMLTWHVYLFKMHIFIIVQRGILGNAILTTVQNRRWQYFCRIHDYLFCTPNYLLL